MSRRTLALIIVLSLVTIILLFVALKPQSPTSQTAPVGMTPKTVTPKPIADVAHTTLSLVPAGSGTLNIQLDSSGDNITGIQIALAYDPKVITVSDITMGKFLANPQVFDNKIDTANGRVDYTFALTPSGIAKAGSGTIATLHYTVLDKTAKETTLTFLPKTVVTAQGVSPSVLKKANSATIKVN